MNREPEQKDNFCMACGLVPVALAGASGAVMSGKAKEKYRKKILIGGILLSIVSVIIMLYYMKRCKSCR